MATVAILPSSFSSAWLLWPLDHTSPRPANLPTTSNSCANTCDLSPWILARAHLFTNFGFCPTQPCKARAPSAREPWPGRPSFQESICGAPETHLQEHSADLFEGSVELRLSKPENENKAHVKRLADTCTGTCTCTGTSSKARPSPAS